MTIYKANVKKITYRGDLVDIETTSQKEPHLTVRRGIFENYRYNSQNNYRNGDPIGERIRYNDTFELFPALGTENEATYKKRIEKKKQLDAAKQRAELEKISNGSPVFDIDMVTYRRPKNCQDPISDKKM